jgi:hypothetical protein
MPIFVKYLLSVRSKVLHKLDSFIVTAWLGFGTVHVCPTRLGAAGWVTGRSVEALIHRAIVAIVKAGHSLRMVITHGQIVWAVLSSIFIAAGWMSVNIAVEVWFVSANPTSKWSWRSWCGWSVEHSCIASLTLRGQCVYHFCTSTAEYVPLIACIHVVEALTVLVAQCAGLIKALAGILLAIVFKAYEVLGRWELITSSCFGTAVSFNAKVGTSSSGSGNRRINSLNGAILKLLSSRINTF